MLQTIGLMLWAYCVARLLQVPVELKGDTGRGWHFTVSVVAILILSALAWSLVMTPTPAATP